MKALLTGVGAFVGLQMRTLCVDFVAADFVASMIFPIRFIVSRTNERR